DAADGVVRDAAAGVGERPVFRPPRGDVFRRRSADARPGGGVRGAQGLVAGRGGALAGAEPGIRSGVRRGREGRASAPAPTLVVARSPDRATTPDRRSPTPRETFGRSLWHGQETVPQRGHRPAVGTLESRVPEGADTAEYLHGQQALQ